MAMLVDALEEVTASFAGIEGKLISSKRVELLASLATLA